MSLKALRAGIRLPNGQVLRLIDPLQVEVDSAYQRPFDRNRAEKIKDDFDPYALGVVQVVQRADGSRFATDGQHRVGAIKMGLDEGLALPTEIPVLITPVPDQQGEAAMFLGCNASRPVTGNAKFKARLVAKCYPAEREIEKWAKKHGFVLDFLNAGFPTKETTRDNGIYSVSTLLEAYNKCREHIEPALRLLKEVWGYGKAKNVPRPLRNGQVIYGIARFLTRQGDKDLTGIIARFKTLNLDLTAVWQDVKKNTGCGYSRTSNLADRITQLCIG